MITDRTPKPGELYRHFKGNLYQIVTVATHTESAEQLVIYQALYGDFKTYARPISMFLSEVDKQKYPDVKQIFRFELIDRDSLNEKTPVSVMYHEEKPHQVSTEEGMINPDLLAFLDAKGYAEKLEILYSIRKRIDDRLMTDIELSLDLSGDKGSIEDRIDYVKKNLQTLEKFESNRLR